MAKQRTLGILTASKSKGLRYGEIDQLCRELIALGDMFGWTVFAFSPEDIGNGFVIGWRFDEAGKRWYSERQSEPQVVYDKLMISAKGRRASYAWLKQASRRGMKLINTQLGSKYRMHRAFLHSPALIPYLPETALLKRSKDVGRWLAQKGSLYVKPVNGTQGRGVMRIGSLEEWRGKRKGLKSLKGLMLQSEIPVHVYQGRRADLRCFMQKDYNGQWQMTFTGVRLGKPNSDVSNLHQGGEALASERYLHFLPIRKRVELFNKLVQLNRRICQILEASFGPLGELGIDWGIDDEGKPWLIEVNPKPGRRLMCLLGAEAERLLSLRRILECAELRVNTERRRGKKRV